MLIKHISSLQLPAACTRTVDEGTGYTPKRVCFGIED